MKRCILTANKTHVLTLYPKKNTFLKVNSGIFNHVEKEKLHLRPDVPVPPVLPPSTRSVFKVTASELFIYMLKQAGQSQTTCPPTAQTSAD